MRPEFINKIMEDTTASDISYLPGGFTTMAGYMTTLSRMKPHWNIKVLEDKDGFKVNFEDNLNVYVPKADWVEFMEQVLRIKEFNSEDMKVDLSSYLKEAKAQDSTRLIRTLESVILKTVAEPPALESDINMTKWSEMFGVLKYVSSKDICLKYERVEQDIQELVSRLREEYATSIGHIQMIIDALEDRSPLGTFEVLSEFDYFAGSIARSNYKGVELIFETTIDLNFDRSEKIIIKNHPEVIDELSADKSVKVVRDEIYPVGEGFQTSFFGKIKDAIKGVKI